MNTLSLKTIQDRYGYELSQISRWQDEGLDLTWPENQINNWIVTNKINPMRKGDPALKAEKMQEEIRLTRARADQQEIDTMKASGEMVLVNDVAGELAKYCLQLKTA
ncbi:terminase small subunit, partial [Salmonella enterica]|nr:terminase small subunit [Salmonella enterica]